MIIIIGTICFILGAVTVSLPGMKIIFGDDMVTRCKEKDLAENIPAKCHHCGWKDKLRKCLEPLPTALILTSLPERVPTCPECFEIVEW